MIIVLNFVGHYLFFHSATYCKVI